MTQLLRNIAIATLCAVLSAVPLEMDAQYRSERGSHRTSQPAHSRPDGNRHNNGNNNGHRPAPGGNNHGNNNMRPVGNKHHGNQGMRPSDNKHHGNQGFRPGNQGGHNRPNRPGPGVGPEGNHRPSGPARPPQHGNNWRPSGGHHNGPGMGPNVPGRPGNMHRPGNIHRPVPPPPMRPNHGHWGPPPLRPYRPVARPWHRPVPPPAWRPRPAAPMLSTILGITFGTALNLSINALVNSGYTIDGYADNTVYLRDVNSYNYLWPDATLYYANGGMNRSEFLYSTPYPDPMRYNSLYANFTGIYGAPVSYSNNGTSISATWFAPNRGYITLQYAPQYALGGQLRYFTTLTLGL